MLNFIERLHHRTTIFFLADKVKSVKIFRNIKKNVNYMNYAIFWYRKIKKIKKNRIIDNTVRNRAKKNLSKYQVLKKR